jgi:hypothetical protein
MLLRAMPKASGTWNGTTHLRRISRGKHGLRTFFLEIRNGDDVRRRRDSHDVPHGGANGDEKSMDTESDI